MNIRYFQKGFNFSQDGPGNRLVYHLQGCAMRCPWCANPEGLAPEGGKLADVNALLDEVDRSRSMFFDGGGVTFTGGEPTLQFEALQYALQALHELGINTAIETNGTHSHLSDLFPLIDHLMIDYKQPFPREHREITGFPLETVLNNLRRACAEHPHVVVHIPLVNGYNASPETIDAFAKTLASFPRRNVYVEPLWYHEYGKEKWERLHMPYTVKNGFIPDKRKREIRDAFKAHGLNVIRT
ncbi:MAG: radical SAM protein [Clostridia bacterium]|nr:radical SAM protein [Clostridia bacterium]